MEDYVSLRTDDGVISIPASAVNQLMNNKWFWARRPVASDSHSDLVARLMLATYNNRARKPIQILPAVLAPRQVSAFQFWLRMKLLRYGLI